MTAQIQISGKAANGIIFVVGGDDYDSFYANLVSVLQSQQAADATLNAARQLISTTGPAPASQGHVTPEQGAQNVQNAFPNATPEQAPPAPPGAQAPTCVHGTRVFKSGTSKAGKAYRMWKCPSTDRASECEAVWIR